MEEAFIEAAELTQTQQTENSVNLARKQALSSDNLAPHQFIRYDCKECGDDLPLFRMQKGLATCTSCQSNIETGRKAFSRASLV